MATMKQPLMPVQTTQHLLAEPTSTVDSLARAVIGAAIEVHRHLGPGYLESTYEEALAIEMHLREISFQRQPPIDVNYKGRPVGQGRLDFLVGGLLVVELKAVDLLAPVHTARVLSYLKATRLHLALVINFNVVVLKAGIKRVVLSSATGGDNTMVTGCGGAHRGRGGEAE